MRLDYMIQALSAAGQKECHRSGQRLASNAAKLDTLSPLKVLGRGYAIPYKEGRAVTSVKDVGVGDRLSLRVSDGEIPCTVDE